MARIGWLPQTGSRTNYQPAVVDPAPVPTKGGHSGVASVSNLPRLGHGGAALAALGGLGAITLVRQSRSKRIGGAGRRAGRANRSVQVSRRSSTAVTPRAATSGGYSSPATVTSTVDLSTLPLVLVPVPVASPQRPVVDKQEAFAQTPTSVESRPAALHVHFLYASPICRPSSAERLPPLTWQAEWQAVSDALRHSSGDLDCEPGDVSVRAMSCSRARFEVTAATVDSISRLATAPPVPPGTRSWWHIAAHSEPETGDLVLEDDDGGAHPIPVSVLSSGIVRPPLGALVLACRGERAGAALLAGGASFVVIARGQLRDVTARVFARHFYRSLLAGWPEMPSHAAAEGRAVRAAFRAAKEALSSSTCMMTKREAFQLTLMERQAFTEPSPAPVVFTVPAVLQNRQSSKSTVSTEEADSESPTAATSSTDSSNAFLLDVEDFEAPEEGSIARVGVAAEYPEDCEDFVGRGAELLQLMRLLGPPEGRRLVVVHGQSGIGKSALGAEFLSFAASPGRRFSPVAGRPRLAFISLSTIKGEELAEGSLRPRCRDLLRNAVSGLLDSHRGRVCLVVDHAELECGWRNGLAAELLHLYPSLCLLLLRRSPLHRLADDAEDSEDVGFGDRWKPVNTELGPLLPVEAVHLFLRRVHRPLFPEDLKPSSGVSPPTRGEPLRPTPELMQQLAVLLPIAECGGNPRRLARLASQVTWSLPSLLSLSQCN